ncbi:MAG: hypothetical protein P8K10_03535 [Crocinitomicaceae bacterium]|jgi:glutathione synthase/RimK-type ligase-like ATP-grasp enzyme|nr:hypothetical protein [Crocinitomicaceae bacterium]
MFWILIIGDLDDPHVAKIYSLLKKKGEHPIVLNPFKGSENSISYTYDPLSIRINAQGNSVEIKKIKSVWWRLKPNLTSIPETQEEFERTKFIHREWQLTLEPLKYFLNECFWINRREADALCRNKPYQLHMAKEEGFKIPNGIISNNSNDVQKRISGFKQVVYKPLSYYIVPPNRILYSSIMTKEEVEQKSTNIEQAPCIFQEYIDKDFELRITIVGKKVFPIKIQSQQNSATKFDWRKDQINVDYEIFDLPKRIEQKLLHLHQKFEMFFGAYDFIVDPKGEYYFLEVNPAGQWLWMEEVLNLNISECIAEALVNKK